MAITRRRPERVIHHSDRGSQTRFKGSEHAADQAGIAMSMGRRGDAYDNAVAESFFATPETELLDRSSFATRTQARSAVFDHTSKGSTTATGGTRPSDTNHPTTTTNNYDQQLRKEHHQRPNCYLDPIAENRPQNRGNSNIGQQTSPSARTQRYRFLWQVPPDFPNL